MEVPVEVLLQAIYLQKPSFCTKINLFLSTESTMGKQKTWAPSRRNPGFHQMKIDSSKSGNQEMESNQLCKVATCFSHKILWNLVSHIVCEHLKHLSCLNTIALIYLLIFWFQEQWGFRWVSLGFHWSIWNTVKLKVTERYCVQCARVCHSAILRVAPDICLLKIQYKSPVHELV